MSTIYLWMDVEGWKPFDSSNSDELKKHGILLGVGASIGEGARIGGGARPIIIYIIGSKHTVSYWGEDRIDIGCHDQSIRLWSEHYKDIGEKEGYSSEDIAEYGRYIEMIAAVHAAKKEEVKS